LLRLRDVKYLHRQQWHQESDKYDNSDIEKRSETHNVYEHRWDIHSVYNRATESDHDNKYSKYNENDETEALSNEHIHK